MKTKIFKSVLPLMAFLMAIGLAFASHNVTNLSKEEIVTGWIHQGINCISVETTCENIGSTLCKTSLGDQVFKDTQCQDVMYRLP